ncbi:MAG: 3-hydroxybutyryl-CoA epimerase [Oscillospiraceae bacterium]|nr:3-hydroxybutyryl-CoA epimerase [Oscillospiraceae bacterium]
MKDKVVIVGAGMMGSGIAAVSALAGCRTVLVDTSEDITIQGLEKARGCIDELVENGLAEKDEQDSAKARIETAKTLENAVLDASLVIEAVYENLELKQELFAKLDNLLPAEVPILSNTSGLLITRIAALVKKHPERTMTAHFWLPGHLIPLVEVVMWEKTDENMAKAVMAELKSWGKAPVLVKKDLPGQLANRMFQAMIREAVNIVKIGLATPEDVDTAIKMGMGIRFPVWGPLEHIDAVGLDLCKSVQETVLPGISKEEGNEYLENLVNEGHLGYKSKKGIYDWSKKDMESLLAKRNEYIIYSLKKLKEWE